jgi:hypothetical protein
MQPEEAQDKHHHHDETDKVNDAVHGSCSSPNNPIPDCVHSNLLSVNETPQVIVPRG